MNDIEKLKAKIEREKKENVIELEILETFNFLKNQKFRVFVSDAEAKEAWITFENSSFEFLENIYNSYESVSMIYSRSSCVSLCNKKMANSKSKIVNDIKFVIEGIRNGTETETSIIFYKKINDLVIKFIFKVDTSKIFKYIKEYSGKTSKSKLIRADLVYDGENKRIYDRIGGFFVDYTIIKFGTKNCINNHEFYSLDQNKEQQLQTAKRIFEESKSEV